MDIHDLSPEQVAKLQEHLKVVKDLTVYQYRAIRQKVDAPVEGIILEWPSHIQDRFFATIEKLNKIDFRSYEVYTSTCEPDPDDQLKDVPEGIYILQVVVRAPALLQ